MRLWCNVRLVYVYMDSEKLLMPHCISACFVSLGEAYLTCIPLHVALTLERESRL